MTELTIEVVDQDGIEAADITLDLVTAIAPDVGQVVLGQQAVLLHPASGESHLLDGTAVVVMECLDGASPLGEITADLAKEFGVDQGTVDTDVLDMVRGLGAAGLLVGVRRERPPVPVRLEPEGVPVGSDLSSWQEWPAPRSDRTLLIHWGTQCGFCTLIGAQLAELTEPLAAAGAEVLLVTTGSVEALAEQLGDVTLPALHVESSPEFFATMGTPSAYVVDRARLTVEPLAVGAYDVPELARRVAGVEEITDEETS